jgi:hypothetical protein
MLTIIDSTLRDNASQSNGVGIDNDARVMLTVANSAFSGDSARFSGGGMFHFDGTSAFANSTFNGHSTSGSLGGGIRNSGT